MSADTPLLDADRVLHLAAAEDDRVALYVPPDPVRVNPGQSLPVDDTRCGRDWLAEGMTRYALGDLRWRQTSEVVWDPTPVEVTSVRMVNPPDASICAACRLDAHAVSDRLTARLPELDTRRDPAVLQRAVALEDIPAGAVVEIAGGHFGARRVRAAR